MKELALQIIEKAFEGKTDKAGKPYVEHLKRVAAAVAGTGEHQYVEIVALLHDLLEDCPEWNEKALRCFFKDNIVDAVVVLTRGEGEDYGKYIDRILKSQWARTVKKFDLIDNMDITRLPKLTDKDCLRLNRYHAAYQIITGFKMGVPAY